VNTVQLHV